jgi:hypothetical protein
MMPPTTAPATCLAFNLELVLLCGVEVGAVVGLNVELEVGAAVNVDFGGPVEVEGSKEDGIPSGESFDPYVQYRGTNEEKRGWGGEEVRKRFWLHLSRLTASDLRRGDIPTVRRLYHFGAKKER